MYTMLNPSEIIQLAKDLVSIPSVSASKRDNGEFHENDLVHFLEKVCHTYHLSTTILRTADNRKTLSVMLKGKTKKTIVLIAHHDTVGIDDMQGLHPFDTDANAAFFKDSNNYLYGRGTGDMKAGIAVGIAVLEALSHENLMCNIIFLSCPDEENESAGILSGIAYLKELKEKEQLDYLGVINLDSGLQDTKHPERKVAEVAGAIGKLLPCFYIVGKSSHASDPFSGLSSSEITSRLIHELHDNPSYCDYNPVTKRLSPPPAFLKAMDIKDSYDTQLPIVSFAYANYHTFQETPKDVLEKMKHAAKNASEKALLENRKKYVSFMGKQKQKVQKRTWDKPIAVFSFGDIIKLAQKNHPGIAKDFQRIVDENKNRDARDVALKLVAYAAQIAQLEGPYIICFFSKPFYPSSYEENTFTRMVEKTITDFAKEKHLIIDVLPFAEGISDTNYMQIDTTKIDDMKTYVTENPYAFFFGDIAIENLAAISMPIANLGPSAFNPHQREEKVEIAYTFDLYPQLLLTLIKNLQTL